jgi:microcompartment protein CcmK/EutM
MLLEKLDPATKQGRKDYVVGMDTVGAGPGDLVQRIALGTHSKDSVDYRHQEQREVLKTTQTMCS